MEGPHHTRLVDFYTMHMQRSGRQIECACEPLVLCDWLYRGELGRKRWQMIGALWAWHTPQANEFNDEDMSVINQNNFSY
jgi:hypothetical protein